MDSLHTTLILPAHARANRAARDPRSTHAAFLRDIAAIVSERSEGARGAVRESGHGFGTLKAGRGARCHAGWRGVPFWVGFETALFLAVHVHGYLRVWRRGMLSCLWVRC